MADYGTLFQLILGAFAFVIVGVLFIVYLMILSSREKKRLKAEEASSIEFETGTEETLQCLHYLGYLSERDKHQPIPDECSRCIKKLDCMNEQQPLERIIPSEMEEN